MPERGPSGANTTKSPRSLRHSVNSLIPLAFTPSSFVISINGLSFIATSFKYHYKCNDNLLTEDAFNFFLTFGESYFRSVQFEFLAFIFVLFKRESSTVFVAFVCWLSRVYGVTPAVLLGVTVVK